MCHERHKQKRCHSNLMEYVLEKEIPQTLRLKQKQTAGTMSEEQKWKIVQNRNNKRIDYTTIIVSGLVQEKSYADRLKKCETKKIFTVLMYRSKKKTKQKTEW